MTIAEQIIIEVEKEYGPLTASAMKGYLLGLGMHGTGELLSSIKNKVKSRRGEVIGISFDLKRYGIFIDKGAGRGYGGTSASGGRMGTGLRKPRPWLWKSIDANEAMLADLVVKKASEIVLDNFDSLTLNVRVER